MNKTDKKEIEVCKWLIKRLEKGYGSCKTSDLDDFPKMYKAGKLSESTRHPGRCASCAAKEMVDLLKEHISILG